ncbi:hypothetical protein [Amycolatopsis minnesotensis]|uniref:hypothetical protein n=1 Tax=Amycolatopsis minnesotensis TaxID=337894 RepID=UPI0031D0D22C
MSTEEEFYRVRALSDSAARRLRVIRYQQAMLLREIAEMEQVSSRRSTVGQVALLHAVTHAAAEGGAR